MAKKITYSQLVNKIEKAQPGFFEQFKIVTAYKNLLTNLKIQTEFGTCSMSPTTLLWGVQPSNEYAISKNDYYLERIKKYRKDLQSVEVVTNYIKDCKITTIKVGDFLYNITPKKLLLGEKLSINNVTDKHRYFIETLKNTDNPIIDNYTFLNEYVDSNTFLYFLTEFGMCKMTPVSIKNSNRLTIHSAVDKQEFWLKYFEKKQPLLFKSIEILEPYVSDSTYILIKNKYGICSVLPTNLLQGYTPTIRTAINKTEYFINQAKEIHGDLYDYSLVKWISEKNKVIVITKNNEFLEIPAKKLLLDIKNPLYLENNKFHYSHKVWCDNGKKSKKFVAFQCYIIRCWNDDRTEEFYKIGKTYISVKERFGYCNAIPYNMEIVKIIEDYEDGVFISEFETKLHQQHKHYSYIPKKNFVGYTECFSKINLNLSRELL